MAELLRRRPSGEWETMFIAAGAPAGKVNTLKEAFAHPQVVARRIIRADRGRRPGRTAHVAGDPMGMNPASRPPVALAEPRGRSAGTCGRASRPASAEPARMPLDGTRVIEMDGNEPSKTLAHADPGGSRRGRAPHRAARAGPAARPQRPAGRVHDDRRHALGNAPGQAGRSRWISGRSATDRPTTSWSPAPTPSTTTTGLV